MHEFLSLFLFIVAMAISFKDVGIKQDDKLNDSVANNRSKIAIGIKTPLELDTFGKELLIMHYSFKEQISDNLRNLLLTNHGERINQFKLGANLRPLLTEYSNKDDFDSEAMLRINTAISTYMPFVVPIDYDSRTLRENNSMVGKIYITIAYSVPALGIQRDQLELELRVI